MEADCRPGFCKGDQKNKSWFMYNASTFTVIGWWMCTCQKDTRQISTNTAWCLKESIIIYNHIVCMQKSTQSNVLMARSSADQLVRWGYALSGLKLLSTFGRREVRQTAEVTPNGGFRKGIPMKIPWFRFRNYSNLPRYMLMWYLYNMINMAIGCYRIWILVL